MHKNYSTGLLSTVLAVILSAGVSLPALAAGGAGGKGAGAASVAGGAGTTNTTTAGGGGGLGVLENTSGTVGGSGGGGAGSTGGAGGQSQILVAVGCCTIVTSPNGVAAAGGATPGASGGNGLNGSDITRTTGGGGGGGAHGAVLTTTTTNAGAIGGNGGNGGRGGYTMGGGGGGAGGYGVVINGSGLSYTNTGTVAGGAGGAGGDASHWGGGLGDGGNGGDGGVGVYFTGSGTLNNSGSIAGGAGGAGGSAVISGGTNGAAGTGGVGVISSGGLTIINSGSISGGLDGSGTVRADAVDFSGGGNTLQLLGGYALVGNVVSTSGTTNGGDTLGLGGATNATLTGTMVGSAPVSYTGTPQFYGFNTLLKTGASTWTITGAAGATPNAISNWNVQGGILSVSGNYNPAATDTLTIGVLPTATTTAVAGTDNGQLLVSGTANLNGALAVNVNAGTYTVGTQYNIVHAGTGVNGTFGSVAYNPAFASYITPQLSYGANDVFLTLNPTTAAFTGGQSTSIGDWSSMQALMASEQTVLNVQGGTAGAILKVNGRPDPAVWVRGTLGSGGAYGANLDSNSLLVGGGDEIRPGLIIGAALGQSATRTSTTQDQVKTRSTGLYLYTLYNNGPLFVDATATAGSMNTNSVRTLPPTTLIASGSTSGSYAGVSGRAGYRITKGNTFVTPYVGAGYLHTRRNAYTETGAGILNLSYAAMSYDIGNFSAGARVGADVQQASGMVVSPWVELGGIVYTGNRNQGQTVTLGAVQQVLPATGAPASAATLNAGLALMSQGNWSAQFVYHGEYSQNAHMNTADVKAVYRW